MTKSDKNIESNVPDHDLALEEIAEDITSLDSSDLPKYRDSLTALDEAYKTRILLPFDFLDEIRATRVNSAQLPEDTTYLDQLYELERTYFDPSGNGSGYVKGSALTDNEFICVAGKRGSVLVTAEHATAHKREGRQKEQDHFVGALSLLMADRFKTSALATLGRQTGDPNWDLEHPFKDKMRHILLCLGSGHIAVHGCARLTDDLLANRSLDLQIGIGNNPTKKTLSVVEELVIFAQELNLRAGVNVPFWQFSTKGYVRLARDNTGAPKVNKFAAANPRTTRSFAQDVIETSGSTAPALQIEIASTLRPQLPSAKRRKTSEQSAVAANQLIAFLGKAVDLSDSSVTKE